MRSPVTLATADDPGAAAEQGRAWTRAAEGEAAAAYALAAMGPLLGDDVPDAAVQQMLDHERTRDAALSRVVEAGGEPPVLPSGYVLPDVAGAGQARAVIAGVEARLAAVYADIVPLLPVGDRGPLLARLTEVTDRAMQWGATAGVWGAADPSS